MRHAFRRARVSLILGGLLLAGAGPVAAQKADTLVLHNGDRIIGEIKTLQDGQLEYKTDNIGTIQVKWNRVAQLTSRHYFEVETRGGGRYFGTFPSPDSAGYLAVALDAVRVLPLEDVVSIERIKQTSFFDRIDGYLDLGFSYAKSNKTVQLTSGLDAVYLQRSWEARLKGDLFMSARTGREPSQIVKLDANENPYGPLRAVREALGELDFPHIYPDPESRALRKKLSAFTGIGEEHLMASAGADELIDLLMRVLPEPGACVLSCPPTFGMYSFDAELNAARCIEVPRHPDFSLDLKSIRKAVKVNQTKILFVASPNNPDGSLLDPGTIDELLSLPLLVVLDEA